jgi:hypothetical protein
MPGNERSQGGNRSPLWRAGRGGREVVIFQDTRFEPGFELSASNASRRRFGQEGCLIDAVEALGDSSLARLLRLKSERVEDGSDGVPAGASRAKAIGMRRELRFPCGFQGLAPQRLPRPCVLGWNTQGTLCGPSTLGSPGASQRCCSAIEMQGCGQSPPSGWREGLHAIDTRRLFATVIVADPTPRQPPCIPRLHQQFLQLVCGSDLSTLRGSVKPFWEAQDMPLDFLPGDVWPGHRQGSARCFGS